MSNKRLIAIFAVLVLLVAAAFTIGSGIAPSPNVLNAPNTIDFPGRHPEAINSRINVEPMDWFQRHPESLNPDNAMDTSDYYARHRGDSTVLNTAGASDWFQRHPESLNPGNTVDLTDYYQRHPGAEVVNRRFPGKEQDDLVITGRSDEWHTPAYQGYTP